MKNLKTVLIGCGVISNTHADVLKKLGRSIVAVCDIDKAKAENLVKKFSLDCAVYTDYKQMLDETRPDVAHILTPHYLHAPMAVEILSRNIHCLCEKPLCISEKEIPLVSNAAKKSKAIFGLCYQHRYFATNKFVKNVADADGFDGSAVFIAWHKDPAYYLADSWRGKFATEGGALLINQAIHYLDQIVWLGGMPKYITAKLSTHTLQNVIEAEDTAEIFLEHEDGVVSQMYATNSAMTNFTANVGVKTKNSCYQFDAKHVFENNSEVDIVHNGVDIDAKSYWGNGHYHLIDHFYQCVECGVKFPIDCDEASKSIKLVLAAYKSNGKKIKID